MTGRKIFAEAPANLCAKTNNRGCSCDLWSAWKQYGPFSWWSQTWSHTAYIWDTRGRRKRRKTGCYTMQLQIHGHQRRFKWFGNKNKVKRLLQEVALKAGFFLHFIKHEKIYYQHHRNHVRSCCCRWEMINFAGWFVCSYARRQSTHFSGHATHFSIEGFFLSTFVSLFKLGKLKIHNTGELA